MRSLSSSFYSLKCWEWALSSGRTDRDRNRGVHFTKCGKCIDQVGQDATGLSGPQEKMVHPSQVVSSYDSSSWSESSWSFSSYSSSQSRLQNQSHRHRENLPFFLDFGKNEKGARLNVENEGAKVNSSSAQREKSMRYVVQKLVTLASKSKPSKSRAFWKFSANGSRYKHR
jgi:hypothetical protein